jgi:hypothetical protein
MVQAITGSTNPVGSALGANYSKPWEFSLTQGATKIKLEKFEVPETFDLGHEVALQTHKYINAQGQPIVRTHFQGAYPFPTSWKGTFTTAVALLHARTIDSMSLSGQPVKFTYGTLSYMVQIKSFKYMPHYQTEVEYEIELIVLQDLNGQDATGLPETFDAQSQALYANGVAQFLILYGYDSAIQNSIAKLAATTGVSIPLGAATSGGG